MALDPRRIVEVTVAIRSSVGPAEFGRTLYLNDAHELVDDSAEHRLHDRVRTYSTFLDLQADYPTGNVFEAAAVYFSQTPYPKPMAVASWFIGGRTGALLNVAPDEDLLTAFAALPNKNLINVTLAGQPSGVIDMSAANSLATIASTLQAGLRQVSGFSGIVCEGSGDSESGIDIFVPASIANIGAMTATPGNANGVTATNAFLAMIGQRTPEVYPAIAANETGQAALARIARATGEWYFVVTRSFWAAQDAGPDIADWCAANNKLLCASSSDPAVLVTGEEASTIAKSAAANRDRWACLWNENELAGAATAAKLAGWDLEAAGTGFTLDSKPLSVIVPSPINSQQASELERKRVSYYADFGSTNRIVGGYVFGSDWADVAYWIDWFQNRLQGAGMRTLAVNPSVPYTDTGMALLVAAFTEVCELGVSNGGIAPGRVSEQLAGIIRATTGNPEFDGNLSTGYMIWHPPVSEASQQDRDDRRAPPINIWVKGSSAIHRVNINVTFEG